MRSHIANRFGIAGGTFAALALGAVGLAAAMPYRLSPSEAALLDIVLVMQVVGPLLGIVFGVLALRGDTRCRRRGVAAISFSVFAILLSLCVSHVHSTSRW